MYCLGNLSMWYIELLLTFLKSKNLSEHDSATLEKKIKTNIRKIDDKLKLSLYDRDNIRPDDLFNPLGAKLAILTYIAKIYGNSEQPDINKIADDVVMAVMMAVKVYSDDCVWLEDFPQVNTNNLTSYRNQERAFFNKIKCNGHYDMNTIVELFNHHSTTGINNQFIAEVNYLKYDLKKIREFEKLLVKIENRKDLIEDLKLRNAANNLYKQLTSGLKGFKEGQITEFSLRQICVNTLIEATTTFSDFPDWCKIIKELNDTYPNVFNVDLSEEDQNTLHNLILKVNDIDPVKIEAVKLQLKTIQSKSHDLNDLGHKAAAIAAKKLYMNLSFALNELEIGQISKKDFGCQCEREITEAHKELDKHRGWKEILENLAIAILGLGIALVIKGVYNKCILNRSFWFVAKTDSEKMLDNLDQCSKEVTAPTA